MNWCTSHRAHAPDAALADRHYNRQSVGSMQFVPPGRCMVLLSQNRQAVWVTSWPFPEFTKHQWAGAWVNSLFRNEGPGRASDLIRAAVAATKARWTPPPLGIVTFVDPTAVRPTVRRGREIFGYCYLKAGFRHVGFTKRHGLWVWQMLPAEMPDASHASGSNGDLFCG
jgi:hypothetical protein